MRDCHSLCGVLHHPHLGFSTRKSHPNCLCFPPCTPRTGLITSIYFTTCLCVISLVWFPHLGRGMVHLHWTKISNDCDCLLMYHPYTYNIHTRLIWLFVCGCERGFILWFYGVLFHLVFCPLGQEHVPCPHSFLRVSSLIIHKQPTNLEFTIHNLHYYTLLRPKQVQQQSTKLSGGRGREREREREQISNSGWINWYKTANEGKHVLSLF
jgi:hypothetical protein